MREVRIAVLPYYLIHSIRGEMTKITRIYRLVASVRSNITMSLKYYLLFTALTMY